MFRPVVALALPGPLSLQITFMAQVITDLYPNVSIFLLPFLYFLDQVFLSIVTNQHGQHLQVCGILHVGTFCFSQRRGQTLAILICLESSFWHSRQNIGFLPAFEQLWKFFAHSDAKKRVEQKISTLIMPRAPTAVTQELTEQQKATLFDIIV